MRLGRLCRLLAGTPPLQAIRRRKIVSVIVINSHLNGLLRSANEFCVSVVGFLRSSAKAMFSPSVAHFRTPCLDCGHLLPTSCQIQCRSSLGSTVPIPFETVEELLGTEEQGVLSNVGMS